jgi:hypothetical protein
MPPVLAENAINARPANAQAPRDYDRPESFLRAARRAGSMSILQAKFRS